LPFHLRMPAGLEESKRQIKLFAGKPDQIPISHGVDTVARLVLSTVADVFLLAPMFTLAYIVSQGVSIMTTSLFVLVFAAVLSLATTASNRELMVAVAAYTAVLVCSLGQTNKNG
jgi:hypothetical protein